MGILNIDISNINIDNNFDETILGTRQEFFFTKAAPIQSITDIALLDF